MTIVESAIVLSTFLLLLFATLDLGLATFRYNMLAGAARELAREAILHGAMAPTKRAEWGAADYEGTAADAGEPAEIVRPLAPTMDAEDVQVELHWLDGDNQANDRVQARLRYSHVPLVPFLSISGPLELTAQATMRIVH